MPKSVYIHIPFCKNICGYCDFSKLYYNKEYIFKYLKSMQKEIKKRYKNEEISTIYIGGGTPSSLDTQELKELFNIIKIFKLSNKNEFTFECNIEDINEDLLIFLKENKVNRLSIGVQSFNKKILKTIGRKSTNKIKEKILLAKKHFKNINIDIIYGINNQTIKDIEEDLNKYLELNIPHISIYSLILENNTKLKICNYQEIDEDINREMYELIIKKLKKNGYNHYEISNFSKKGYESKHNLTYWDNEKYYGFGLGASGYINNVRYTNTRSINKYLEGKYEYEKEKITKNLDMEYFMILGLRKIKGISKKEFKKRYNCDLEKVYDLSMLSKNKNNYYISESNLYISNSILINFINIE